MDDLKRKKIEEDALELKNLVKIYENFPKPGISFKDFFPIFQNDASFHLMIKLLIEHIRLDCTEVEAIFGLESRGFLIGPLIAYKLHIPFYPIRKSGKLPGNLKKISYELEYGIDELEVQCDSLQNHKKVILLDDLLATGGTLKAANRLLENCKINILENIVIIELVSLKGRFRLEKDGVKVFSLIKYD